MLIAVIEPLEVYVRALVRSISKKSNCDCCDRAHRGMSKGSVRSVSRKPNIDCCDRAPRSVCKGSSKVNQ